MSLLRCISVFLAVLISCAIAGEDNKPEQEQLACGDFSPVHEDVSAIILDKIDLKSLISFSSTCKQGKNLVEHYIKNYTNLFKDTLFEERQHLMGLHWPEIKFASELDRLCYNSLLEKAVKNIFAGIRRMKTVPGELMFKYKNHDQPNSKYSRGYAGENTPDFEDFFATSLTVQKKLQQYFEKHKQEDDKVSELSEHDKTVIKPVENNAELDTNHAEKKNKPSTYTYKYFNVCTAAEFIEQVLEFLLLRAKCLVNKGFMDQEYLDSLQKKIENTMDTKAETGRVELNFLKQIIIRCLICVGQMADVEDISINSVKIWPANFGKQFTFFQSKPDLSKFNPDDIVVIDKIPDDLKEKKVTAVVLDKSHDLPKNYQQQVLDIIRSYNGMVEAVTLNDSHRWAMKFKHWLEICDLRMAYRRKNEGCYDYVAVNGVVVTKQEKFEDDTEKNNMLGCVLDSFDKAVCGSWGMTFIDYLYQLESVTYYLKLTQEQAKPYIVRALNHPDCPLGGKVYIAYLMKKQFWNFDSLLVIYEDALKHGYEPDCYEKVEATDYYTYHKRYDKALEVLEGGLNDQEYKPFKGESKMVAAAALNWFFGKEEKAIEWLKTFRSQDDYMLSAEQHDQLEKYVKNPKDSEFLEIVRLIKKKDKTESWYENVLFRYSQLVLDLSGVDYDERVFWGNVTEFYHEY